MKKRKLQLDKELISTGGADSGNIIKSASLILTVISALEPEFCDCLDSDSCQPVEPSNSACEGYSDCGNCTRYWC